MKELEKKIRVYKETLQAKKKMGGKRLRLARSMKGKIT